jgi:glycosyltransferase involved in cell wall biosynthesis
MLQGEVKWSAFYNCEAFILPSHQENFGIAVVEAMACAKPILISDKVNIWQEIKNSHAGFVENDTENGTENLLNKWCASNSEERKSMGNNAQSAFQKYFTVEQAAHNLINTINTTTKHA